MGGELWRWTAEELVRGVDQCGPVLLGGGPAVGPEPGQKFAQGHLFQGHGASGSTVLLGHRDHRLNEHPQRQGGGPAVVGGSPAQLVEGQRQRRQPAFHSKPGEYHLAGSPVGCQ